MMVSDISVQTQNNKYDVSKHVSDGHIAWALLITCIFAGFIWSFCLFQVTMIFFLFLLVLQTYVYVKCRHQTTT